MSDVYKVGLIGRTGHGDYGHTLDTAWRGIPNAQIVAIADDDPTGLAAAMKRLELRSGFVDYREMLDVAQPDIVTICPRWVDKHHEMAITAAERGIHIYMDKPFCRTPREADEIVAACEYNRVKCVIGHPTRFSPMVDTVLQLITDGAIGDVLEFRTRGREDLRDGRERGGAEDLWILGTHLMNLIHTFGGDPKWCFAIVTVDGRPAERDDLTEGQEGTGLVAGDTINAMYGMPADAVAYFGSRRGVGGEPSRYGLQIYGSRGILEILEGTMPSVNFLDDPSWSPGRTGKRWQNVSSAGIGQPEPLNGPKYQARHWLAIEELIAAIEEERYPKGGAHESRWTTEMIAAVFDSHYQNRPVEFPLVNRNGIERFS